MAVDGYSGGTVVETLGGSALYERQNLHAYGKKILATSSGDAVKNYIKAEAENLKNAADASEANAIRERMLDVFTPVRGKPAPADQFKSDYASGVNHTIGPRCWIVISPGVAINAIMVLAGIKYFDTDAALKKCPHQQKPGPSRRVGGPRLERYYYWG